MGVATQEGLHGQTLGEKLGGLVALVVDGEVDAVAVEGVGDVLLDGEGSGQPEIVRPPALRKVAPVVDVAAAQGEGALGREGTERAEVAHEREVVAVAQRLHTATAEGRVGEELCSRRCGSILQEVAVFGGVVVGKVVAFEGVDALVLLGKAHHIGFAQSAQRAPVGRSCSAHHVAHRSAQRTLFESEIEGSALGELDVAKHLARLVIFKHAHREHIVGADVARGQSVVAFEEVEPFDVEAVDALALIFDLP